MDEAGILISPFYMNTGHFEIGPTFMASFELSRQQRLYFPIRLQSYILGARTAASLEGWDAVQPIQQLTLNTYIVPSITLMLVALSALLVP